MSRDNFDFQRLNEFLNNHLKLIKLSAFNFQLSTFSYYQIGITPKIEIVYIDRVRKLNPLNPLNLLNHLNLLKLSAVSYQLSAV